MYIGGGIMNLLTIAVIIVLLWKIAEGYKRGMVKEIISFISLIVLCIVAALIVNGMQSYMEKQFVGVVIAVLLLCVVGIVHHLLGVVFFSAKLISKLPVIHGADKLLGMVAGVLETVLILWTVYLFVMKSGLGMLGQQILVYTEESPILLWLYRYNFLAMWVENILSKINW